MARLELFRGVDWREASLPVWSKGTFGVAHDGASTASLSFGTAVLQFTGTGLETTSGRTITAGVVTSIKLIVDGKDVALLDTFASPYTAAVLQALLDQPPTEVWNSFVHVFAGEALEIVGSSAGDQILATPGNDSIDGGDGRDYIYGFYGDDTIVATDSDNGIGDYIQPGLGTNLIVGNMVDGGPSGWTEGHDLAFNDLTVAVVANLNNGLATAPGMRTTFSEVNWIAGGAGDDLLTGGNRWFSEEGFVGMVGDDTINGKGGIDFVDYREETTVGSVDRSGVWVKGSKGVNVDLASGKARDSFGDHDQLAGIEDVHGTRFADRIYGKSGMNELFGHGGNDKLDGREGRDELEGGAGRDTLTGGLGADDFIFREIRDSGATSAKRDYITDFLPYREAIPVESGLIFDGIDLVAIDANTTKAGDQAFKFDARGSAGTIVKKAHIGWHYVDRAGSSDDRTIIKINVDDDPKLEMQIELRGLINLSHIDFDL